MSRYVNDVPTSMSPDEVERTVSGYLGREGFERTRRGSEEVWKKGMGLIMGPQFIRADRVDGKVHIEAWTTVALLPGVYVGEMGTRGVVGFTAKRMLRQRIAQLEGVLHDVGDEARPETPRPEQTRPPELPEPVPRPARPAARRSRAESRSSEAAPSSSPTVPGASPTSTRTTRSSTGRSASPAGWSSAPTASASGSTGARAAAAAPSPRTGGS